MINAQPRFALQSDGRLFDYVTGRVVDATGHSTDEHGTWDLAKVRSLIEAGKPVESAFTSLGAQDQLDEAARLLEQSAAALEADKGAVDKVEQANADFQSAPLPQ